MKEMPQSVTIYGAGVVGCEYASMFRNLRLQGESGEHPTETTGVFGR